MRGSDDMVKWLELIGHSDRLFRTHDGLSEYGGAVVEHDFHLLDLDFPQLQAVGHRRCVMREVNG